MFPSNKRFRRGGVFTYYYHGRVTHDSA